MFYRGLHGRVTKLETDVAAIGTDVKDVQTVVGGLGGKIDKLVDGLSSTDGRAAERAQAVKVEMRDEHDRKAKERSGYLTSGLALLGAMSIVIAAFCGPYVSEIRSTSQGQADNTFKIGQVRETLAEQGADLSKHQFELDVARDRNHIQDAELREHDQAIASIKARLGL